MYQITTLSPELAWQIIALKYKTHLRQPRNVDGNAQVSLVGPFLLVFLAANHALATVVNRVLKSRFARTETRSK